MATKKLPELIAASAVIHDETADAANTAARVGDLFAEIVRYIQTCLTPDAVHIKVTQTATNVQVAFLLDNLETGQPSETALTLTIPAASDDGAGVVTSDFGTTVQAAAAKEAKAYTDTKTADTLASAKAYTDTKISSANYSLAELLRTEYKAADADLKKDYTYKDTVTLSEAKAYTDASARGVLTTAADTAQSLADNALTSAKTYADTKADAAETEAVTEAKAYTDTKISSANYSLATLLRNEYKAADADLKKDYTYNDTVILSEAKGYTDAKIKAAIANIGNSGSGTTDTALAARVAALETLLLLN